VFGIANDYIMHRGVAQAGVQIPSTSCDYNGVNTPCYIRMKEASDASAVRLYSIVCSAVTLPTTTPVMEPTYAAPTEMPTAASEFSTAMPTQALTLEPSTASPTTTPAMEPTQATPSEMPVALSTMPTQALTSMTPSMDPTPNPATMPETSSTMPTQALTSMTPSMEPTAAVSSMVPSIIVSSQLPSAVDAFSTAPTNAQISINPTSFPIHNVPTGVPTSDNASGMPTSQIPTTIPTMDPRSQTTSSKPSARPATAPTDSQSVTQRPSSSPATIPTVFEVPMKPTVIVELQFDGLTQESFTAEVRDTMKEVLADALDVDVAKIIRLILRENVSSGRRLLADATVEAVLETESMVEAQSMQSHVSELDATALCKDMEEAIEVDTGITVTMKETLAVNVIEPSREPSRESSSGTGIGTMVAIVFLVVLIVGVLSLVSFYWDICGSTEKTMGDVEEQKIAMEYIVSAPAMVLTRGGSSCFSGPATPGKDFYTLPVEGFESETKPAVE